MNIIVIGTRGIPDVLGGVETHCEELYPLLVGDFNHNVLVLNRSCYTKDRRLSRFKGIRLKNIYAPKSKALEAIVHSILAVLYAGIKRPDIVHIHAVGPNLVTPLARLLGLKVVMTHHGPDYERKKWGKLAKCFLKMGEWAGVKFANEVIVISEEIKESIAKKYGRTDTILIPNGVSIQGRPAYNEETLSLFAVERYKYIFTLGRFVPEKGFDYLIRAFVNSGLSNKFKLVLAGDADHESEYSIGLKKLATDSGVVLTGFIRGPELAQLFSNCILFVLPSFYEGLPISLLEAMAYNLPILASDIPANTQVALPTDAYFSVGNEKELEQRLSTYLKGENLKTSEIYNIEQYNWKNIAISTNDVYRRTLRKDDYCQTV